MLKNPNEYHDASFARLSVDLDETVYELWEAGAEEADIRNVFENALKNALAS